jgi:transcriptional regulator of NAD metabolism
MTAEKKEKVQPKTQKVYRNYNGTWDDIDAEENPDTSSWKLTYDREFTKDGELVYEIELDVAGNEVQKQLNTYNDKEKIVRHELYNEGQLVETIVFEYNDKGLLASEYREFEEGYPLRTLYTYDDENRIIEKRVEDSDGEQEKREVFEYHPEWKDKVVKHEVYDEEDELTTVEETEFELRDGEVKTKIQKLTDNTINQVRKTVFYDAKGREDNIAYVTYNEKDKALELFKVMYDEHGREVEERSESVLPSENFEVIYTYDDEDRIIHQEHRQGDRILSKHNRRFNEKHLPSFHGFRSANRGMHVDYFEYTYFN